MSSITSKYPHFETAMYTLRAVMTHLSAHRNVELFDEEPPSVNGGTWVTRLRVNGETTISWHLTHGVGGVTEISRSVSFLTPDDIPIDHTVTVARLVPSRMTAREYSSAILQEILGVDEVPLSSRKEAKEWEKVAQQDAAFIYNVGVKRVLESDTDPRNLEDADLFDLIHTSAEDHMGYPLGRHKESWVSVGVPFRSSEVYRDAFNSKAIELVSTISRSVQ